MEQGGVMMRNNNWKKYAAFILFTEAVGGIAGLITRKGTEIFNATVTKPALSPPAVVFPIAWAILYALMGIGAARIAIYGEGIQREKSLKLYLLQLGFNFLWSILFFSFQAYGFAFLWLVALWGLIVWMTLSFSEIDGTAAWLQVPYLLWVLFAGYLNLGVWLLNR